MSEQLALLPGYLTAHLQLTLAALLLGVMVSVPLGVLVARVHWLEPAVLGAATVIQTIPSLALLAVMVPLLAAARLQSIGFLPAFVGLVLYSVLPVLRNTVTALGAVDPAYTEAAMAVGMTRRQQLLRVELPLAAPVMIAGLRTAAVWTVGIATLSTPVGATSLGNYIFSGLQTRNLDAIVVGCVAAAVLALALDGLIRLIGSGWERRQRGVLAAALALLAALYVFTGVVTARSWLGGGRAPIVVGAKTFTEQYILSEMLAARITHRTGLHAQVAQSLGSTVVFDALRAGDIDVYVDYSGTIWATVMRRETGAGDRDQVMAEVGAYLAESHGIAVLAALGFENAYALAMRRDASERLGVRTISDLVARGPALSIGGDYEFFGRAEWRALRERYQLRFGQQRSMDSSLMYQALAQGDVDVISAFSTDGRIAAFDLVVLEDDRGAIPPYDAIVLARPGLQRDRPGVVEALGVLVGAIDDATMRELNRAVDVHGASPRTVARAFLESFRGGSARPGDAGFPQSATR